MSDQYSSIEALFSAIAGKSEKDVADIMQQFAAAFEYQGFDPRHVLGLLAEKCRKLKLDEAKMVVLAIGTLVARGTKVNKIKGKSLDEYKAALDNLSRILTTKTGQALSKNDITLPRIAACYPELTARFVTKHRKSIIPGYEDIHPLLASHCFSAVCPSDADYINHAKVNIAWNIDFDKLVRPRDPTPPNRTALFWRAGHASAILSDADRRALMKDINMVAPSRAWMDANAVRLSQVPPFEFAAPVMTESIRGSAFRPRDPPGGPGPASGPGPSSGGSGPGNSGGPGAPPRGPSPPPKSPQTKPKTSDVLMAKTAASRGAADDGDDLVFGEALDDVVVSKAADRISLDWAQEMAKRNKFGKGRN